MNLDKLHLGGWISRQNLLVAGTLLLTLSPVLSVAFFSGAALVTVFSGEPIRLTKEKKWLTGILFFISLGFAAHNHLPEAWGPGRVAFTDYVPFFWFFYSLSLKPFAEGEIKKVLYAFLLTVPQQFFLALGERYFHWQGRFYFPTRNLPIVDLYWGPSEKGLATAASFFNPNILALYAIMGFIFSVTLLFKEWDARSGILERNSRLPLRILFLFLGLMLSSLLLLWTHSRNAWFFLLMVVLIFAWMKPNRGLQLVAIGLILVTVLALFNLVFPTSMVKNFLPQALSAKLTVFSSDRTIFYNLALDLILEKPWWGWGIGTFPALVSGKLWYPVLHTHSIFFQLAVEVGLPLAILVIGLLGTLFVSTARRIIKMDSVRNRKEILDKGLLISGAVIFLMQFFDLALLMTYRLNFLFWLCIAIPYSRVSANKNAGSVMHT
ncbi:MAG: O-antigen ligase family protein [Deltaproteobacteria bacterium]|nr:O-antigen ligase family protein [Deltaproteobacteria bacterium]